MRLAGKKALITAAAAGIGRETALQFVREGAEVWALDIDSGGLNSLAAETAQIKAQVLDLTNTGDLQSFIASAGSFDILFNCAGYVAHGDILSCSLEDWQTSFDLNVKAMYVLTKLVIPGMATAGAGSIINMASVVGVGIAAPSRFAYSATKAAVVGMTKSVACDYVSAGIRCNAICPGTVDTPSLQARLNAFDDPEKARAEFAARQPLGRLGQAEEVAALAVYLASDESAYTTGVAHYIDGGWSNGGR
ncbi:MAG: SDR family oxidoreductase [Pseudomonadota bacterium]